MESTIISLIEKFGYAAIFFLITIENIFPPIPSEIVLAFGGVATTKTSLVPILVILFATLGAVAGAFILYFIGRFFSPTRLKKIISGKVGKILRLKENDIDKAFVWFEKRGKLTIFFCRFIPIIRSLISIPAGMSKMNIGIFTLLTALGTLIWNVVLVLIGRLLGDNWRLVVDFISKYAHICLYVFIVLFIGFLIYFFKFRKKSEK
jgi:membrane protein DedA with SNARE-associated domain